MGLSLAKLGWLNFKRRKTSTILIIIGLLISTSIITSSLVVGDSMIFFVEESTYRNLGEVDITVSSFEFYDYELYTALRDSPDLQKVTDKTAPIIMITASARNENENMIDLNCNLVGIDENFYDFGNLVSAKGERIQPMPVGDEVILNSHAASNLKADPGNVIQVTIQNPVSSLESMYVDFDRPRTLEIDLKVQQIVKNKGLGNFQLEGRREKSSNIFINIAYLQSELVVGNKINTIIVSNKGDERSGIELDSEVQSTISVILDNEIGYSDVGLELDQTDNYFLLTTSEIFFKYDYYELLHELEEEMQINGDDDQIAVSPFLTYFVNSISTNDGKTISYSTVTGIDPVIDEAFGAFHDKATGNSVTAQIAANEIILNNWTAEQLQVSKGDILAVNYTVIDRLYNLETYELELTVQYIVSIDGKASDPELMPDFPGLQGIDSCFNWDPPFPLDLATIEAADVEYWQFYRGTPKGYIYFDTAREHWGNDLGELTGVKILPVTTEKFQELDSDTLTEYKSTIGEHLDENIGHRDAGLSIITVKSDSLETARGMNIFPMMFMAFGMIIILAGIILIINIFITQSESRRFELGLIRALGFNRRQLTKILVFEGLIYAVIASIIGVFVGLAIGYFLIQGLNSIWSDAVEGNVIPFYFNFESVVIAFIAGFIVTLMTILIISIKIGKMNIVQVMRTVTSETSDNEVIAAKAIRSAYLYGFLVVIAISILIFSLLNRGGGQEISDFKFILFVLSPMILIIGVAGLTSVFIIKGNPNTSQIKKIKRGSLTSIGFMILIYIIIVDLVLFNRSDIPFLGLYFLSGILLVFSSVLIVVTNLGWIAAKLNSGLSRLTHRPSNSVFKLSTLYPVRSLKRSGMTIGLFALVLFIIAALGVNVAIQTANLDHHASTSSGGYDIMGETNLPIKFDLNNPDELSKNNISSPSLSLVEVTAIKMVGEEGGTCSNMNVRYPPRLLGVDRTFRRENKFGFASAKGDETKPKEVWSKLNAVLPDNRIPIIVEFNTLVWIYEEDLGSVFKLDAESGDEYELEVIGVTDSSVLAGTFIMSEENLDMLFPKSADYHLFLFKVKDSDNVGQLAVDLEQELSSIGMDTVTVQDRLLDDIRYEQSFMALFQVFLGLGLIIGVVGLGVITIRTIHERRWEIGVLRAIGFKRNMILKLFLTEIIFIVIIGIIIGILIGILSSYLSFNLWKGANYQYIVPWDTLLLLGGIVLIVTILCVIYPAYKASKIPPVEALRYLE